MSDNASTTFRLTISPISARASGVSEVILAILSAAFLCAFCVLLSNIVENFIFLSLARSDKDF